MTPAPAIGTAVAKRVDCSLMPAVFDVVAVRGFGDQRRIFVRYKGHQGPHATLVKDPDAGAYCSAGTWVSCRRFHVTMNEPAVEDNDLAYKVTLGA